MGCASTEGVSCSHLHAGTWGWQEHSVPQTRQTRSPSALCLVMASPPSASLNPLLTRPPVYHDNRSFHPAAPSPSLSFSSVCKITTISTNFFL